MQGANLLIREQLGPAQGHAKPEGDVDLPFFFWLTETIRPDPLALPPEKTMRCWGETEGEKGQAKPEHGTRTKCFMVVWPLGRTPI